MYIGYRGRTIVFVSQEKCTASDACVLEAPKNLSSLSPEEIFQSYTVWHGQLVPKTYVRPAKDLKIAFVGVWKIPCGISTYSEFLFPEIIKQVSDYRIFSEYADVQDEDPKVIRCWKRGQPLNGLVHKINDFNPDVVLVQHEYGIFPNAQHWISFITKMGRYKTVVTMHSTYRHKDKVVCIAATPEVILHTDSAKKILTDEMMVPSKVHVIPHGSHPVKSTEKYWNIYQSKKTLVQFGFGFPYKGWEQALETVAKLKERGHKDVFFTGLFSESPFSKPLHDEYYGKLENLVQALGIEENVGFVRGFLHEKVLESYLRTNEVAVFPYIPNGEHTVYACSGAARVAMHCNIPVVVTKVPLFDDLEGVNPRAASVEELANAVEDLWANPLKRQALLKRQQDFLNRTSWKNVAQQHVDIFTQP